MGLSSKVGSFIIDTSKTAGQTQAITGVGFTPKIVLFFWGGTTSATDTVVGQNISAGFGATNGSTHCSSTYFSLDGSAASDSSSTQYGSRILLIQSAAAVTDGYYNASSMDSDGFTLTVGDQYSLAQRITFLALGGTDITNTYIGAMTTGSSAGVEYDITGVGFQPDVALFTGYASSTSGAGANNGYLFVGMTSGSSEQGVVSNYIQDAQATTNTSGYGYNGEVISSRIGGERDSFVSFISDGVRLNHITGTARVLHFIAIKGGQYHVGEFTTRTGSESATIGETGVGFTPSAIFFASANRPHSTQGSYTEHAKLSFGAVSSDYTQQVQANTDEDNLADSRCTVSVNDGYIYQHVSNDAQDAAANLNTLSSDGFSMTMTDFEPSVGSWVTYLAIGALSSGSTTLAVNDAVQAQTAEKPILTTSRIILIPKNVLMTQTCGDTDFPSVGITDDFNRVSLGSNWTITDGTPSISSNKLITTDVSTTSLYWNQTNFGLGTSSPGIDAYVTAGDLDTSGCTLFMRYLFIDSSTYYMVRVQSATQTGCSHFELYVGGVATVCDTGALTWSSRTSIKFGVRHKPNGYYTLYLDRGSGWEAMIGGYDLTYTSSG